MADVRGWLIERGIGEVRAALVQGGAIVEAAVELPGTRAGAIVHGRLTEIVGSRAGIVSLDGGGEAMIQPLPPGLTQGCKLAVAITREAIGHKRPLCRAAPADVTARDGPDLASRIAATGAAARVLHAHEPDLLEAAGWSEVLEGAATGVLPFTGGSLLMSLTPAMILFDVDGTLPPADLAVAGAGAAGRAIRLLGVAGSIGIDLPTAGDKAGRQAAAAALDDVLPPPFERTAVNGFGLLQIVRPQARASLPQILAEDRVGAAARALLRRAERAGGHGALTLVAHPAIVARLDAERGWLDELARRTGVPVALRADAGRTISGGHAERHP